MDSRPDDKRTIARRFRALRRRALLSQADLANLVCVSRSTVNRIENQGARPHPTTWEVFNDLEDRHKAGWKYRLLVHWR